MGDEPGFGVVTPADPALVVDLLGTDRPDADALWAARDLFEEEVEGRWEGTYVLGYSGGEPSMILFVGVSGD